MPTTEDRKRANFNRRVLAVRKGYNMKWSRRQSDAFVERLMLASSVEGIDDMDLRVLIRMYNRELIGAS